MFPRQNPLLVPTVLSLVLLLAALALLSVGCGESTKGLKTSPSVSDAHLSSASTRDQPASAAFNDSQSGTTSGQLQRDYAYLASHRTNQPAAAPKKEISWNDTPHPVPETLNPAPAQQADSPAGALPATAAAGLPAPVLPPPATQPSSSSASSPQPAAIPIKAPAETPQARLQRLMDELTKELYHNSGESDSPVPQLLTIAALTITDPSRAKDLHQLKDLTPQEQELLATLQSFFSQLGTDLKSSPDPYRTVTDSVTKLRGVLLANPPFAISSAQLCTSVDGFGKFAAFSKNAFIAGVPQPVIVYLELQNFSSKQNDEGLWSTSLQQHISIFASKDQFPVWTEDWQDVLDENASRRNDFFTVQLITLPKALTVGKYDLKIRVKDTQRSALAERSIPFEIVADPKLAAVIPGK